MVTDLPEIGRQKHNDAQKGMQAMLYDYDQLNRIVKAQSLTEYTPGTGFNARTAEFAAYDVDYSYDPNGNLLTLQRRNENDELLHDFNYQYYAGTNRLSDVIDTLLYTKPVVKDTKIYETNPLVSDGIVHDYIIVRGDARVLAGADETLEALTQIDIDPNFEVEPGALFTARKVDEASLVDQMGNYEYDEIGNLIKDKIAGVVDIQWTPYGKVRQVIKADSSKISFRYDGAGNRIEKKITRNDSTFFTHYLRDASGNILAVYNDSSLIEQPIYGSSRLGQYLGHTSTGKRTLGHKNYELTNHLGNVLTVVTDNISMSTIDTIRATVASASDYYPFGLQMPGRTVSDTLGYRYGFNGKERDPASEWGQTHYDYGFRIYNPQIAKFLSVDPLTKDYPWYTPYQFAGNTPIQAIDLDGLEEIYYDESINRGGFKLAVYILTNAGLMEEFKENFQMENNEFDLYLISRRLNTSIDIDQGEVKQGTLAQTHMRPIKLQGEGAEYVELEKQNIRSLYKNNLNEDKVYEQTLSKGKGALVVEISEELFDMIEKNMNNPSTRESSLNLLEITAETIIHELSLHVLDAKNEKKYYFSNGNEDKRGAFAHMYYYNLDKPSTHSPKYSEIKNNSTAGKNKEKIKIQVDILRDKKSRPIKVD